MNDIEEIRARCIQLVASAKQIPADSIRADSTFEDLNMDSLDKMTLAFDVEEAYNISIPDNALNTITGIETMAEGVSTMLAERNAETPAA